MSGDANSFVEPSIGAARRYSTALSTQCVDRTVSAGSTIPNLASRTLSGWRQLTINTKAIAAKIAIGRAFLLLKIDTAEQRTIAKNNKAGGTSTGVSRLAAKLPGGIVKKKTT